MPHNDIDNLVTVMVKLHGDNAEDVARRRAHRCDLTQKNDWAKTWSVVANEIAKRVSQGVLALGLALGKYLGELAT